MLNDKERKQLVAILGMMGSSQDGEALNAARLACAFIKQRNLTWEQVLGNVPKPADWEEVFNQSGFDPAPKKGKRKADHVKMADEILNSGTTLSAKELSFVEDMLSWNSPTPKQMDWLSSIHSRVFGI